LRALIEVNDDSALEEMRACLLEVQPVPLLQTARHHA
jgi:hypothetical protein